MTIKKFKPGKESVYGSYKKDSFMNEFCYLLANTGADDVHLDKKKVEESGILRKQYVVKLKNI